MSLTSTNLWATTGCSVNLLLFACVALTLEAKWVIRLKNIVIAWSLAMYGKWMNQMLPFMMQANFKHYFNKLWIIFIWLILLSFFLDDRGHFSKCITVFHQVLFKYFTLENSMIFNIRDFYPKELTLKIMRWVSFTQHATKPLSDCLGQVWSSIGCVYSNIQPYSCSRDTHISLCLHLVK